MSITNGIKVLMIHAAMKNPNGVNRVSVAAFRQILLFWVLTCDQWMIIYGIFHSPRLMAERVL